MLYYLVRPKKGGMMASARVDMQPGETPLDYLRERLDHMQATNPKPQGFKPDDERGTYWQGYRQAVEDVLDLLNDLKK